MEISQSLLKSYSNCLTDLFSLGDQLVGVVKCYDGFKDLIDHRWENSTIVIHSKVSVDGKKSFCFWSEQDS